MHPSSFLLAAVVFAVPARAVLSLSPAIRPSETFGLLEQLAGRMRAVTISSAPAAEPAPPRLLAKPGKDRYDETIRAEARAQGLDPRLVKSVIAAESEFTTRAQSPAGAKGLMQVMPETAASVGVPGHLLFDPIANIRAGTRYLAYLFARAWARFHLQGVAYADAPRWLVQRIITAYNAGPRWIFKRVPLHGAREYVRRVLSFYRSSISELRAAA